MGLEMAYACFRHRLGKELLVQKPLASFADTWGELSCGTGLSSEVPSSVTMSADA